jgi:hypothetical protein
MWYKFSTIILKKLLPERHLPVVLFGTNLLRNINTKARKVLYSIPICPFLVHIRCKFSTYFSWEWIGDVGRGYKSICIVASLKDNVLYTSKDKMIFDINSLSKIHFVKFKDLFSFSRCVFIIVI